MSNIVFTDQEKELIFKYNIIQKLTPKGIESYAAMTNEWSDNSKNYVSGLIVGYEKNNKIEYCTSKEDIKNPGVSDFIVLSKNISDNKPKLIRQPRSYINYTARRIKPQDIECLRIKIKDSELSAKVFGLKKDKTALIDKVYSNYKLDYGRSKKLDAEIYYIIVTEGDRTFKFVIPDVEFLSPSFKGWNPAKDKTIKNGSTVVIKSDETTQPWKVIEVYPDQTQSSKRISKVSNNRYRDLMVIRNQNGVIKRVYAKHLKLVE